MAKYFGIDLRALSGARILLSLAVLYDLAIRWSTATAFLSDEGVLTVAQAKQRVPLDWLPSLHCLSGSLEWQRLLLFLHGLAALALLLGWRTRVVTPLCWYLTLSLHFRNELVLNGGDYFLRYLLFWAMFLPLNCHYSLDEKAGRAPQHKAVIGNLATAGLYLQVALLYWGAAMTKAAPVWTQEHLALYYALHLDSFATPLGVWVREQSALLPLATRLAYWLEWLAPLLLFLGKKPLRLLGVTLLSSLHIGIALCMHVGLFWLFPCCALLALAPLTFRDQESEEPTLAPALSALVGLTMLVQPYLNLSQLRPGLLPIPRPLFTITRTLGFHYGWNMFARINENVDGWYVVEARLENGATIDLLTQDPVTLEKPAAGQMYKNQRWRRYMLDLYRADQKASAEALASYLRRDWESRMKIPVTSLSFHYVAEPTPYPYEPTRPHDQVLFHMTFGPEPVKPERPPAQVRSSPLPRPPKKRSRSD